MPQAKDIVLTQGEYSALEELLLSLDPQTLTRGRAMFREKAVRDVYWAATGEVIEARIQGSKLFTSEIHFRAGAAAFCCDCEAGSNLACGHAAALAMELLARARQGDRDDTAETGPSRRQESALTSLVKAKTGKPLSVTAVRFLNAAETWRQGKLHEIERSTLASAMGTSGYFGYSRLHLYPADLPPESPAEFLAYLEAAMRSVHLTMPAPIPEAVDPGLQKQLIARWSRFQEVERWTATLNTWQEVNYREKVQAPELRLMLHSSGATAQIRHPGETEFGKIPQKALKQLTGKPRYGEMPADLNAGSSIVLQALFDEWGNPKSAEAPPLSTSLTRSLAQLLSSSELSGHHVVTQEGEPLEYHETPLRWELTEPAGRDGDYLLRLLTEQGTPPPPPVAILPGTPLRYITPGGIYPLSYWPFGKTQVKWPVRIPAPAVESRAGVRALGQLGVPVPPRLAGKVKLVKPEISIRCRVRHSDSPPADYFQLNARASFGMAEEPVEWSSSRWEKNYSHPVPAPSAEHALVQIDKSTLAAAAAWLSQMPMREVSYTSSGFWLEQRITGKNWPNEFIAWLDRRPKGLEVELDAELASLRDGRVAGHISLEIEETKSGIDWFDLSVALKVTDTTLTQEEIDLLLKAKGAWVKLADKGWRRLEFTLTEAQEQELADLGLGSHQLTGEKQRLHALQLASLTKKNHSLLAPGRALPVQRRLEEIQTRVTPKVPRAITASLRPYQAEGFHFLAYLSANRFGGVLADDMGLGKTLQALTWVAWLRGAEKMTEPVLVVCPKSVQDNWRGEAARFFPELPVRVWDRKTTGKTGLNDGTGLLVIGYAQLRSHEEVLTGIRWGAVILDEAQAIKNPSSQNAKAACGLHAKHRLALTGTPIENRLLDLWSIFAFAMPGILGNRSSFTKLFDAKEDPLARRRLSARTRPFLLRRTKKEVAGDLPERVEEDLIIELEGTQATLYQAELKRARAQLLKAETGSQLDKLRFTILTSLLRLRQICCHPRLIGFSADEPAAPAKTRRKSPDSVESAKVGALMELLEQLMDDGQKVLVFSQFTGMLDIIEEEITRQEWTRFKLTGQTEDRGPLVQEFQDHPGAAVFLISLKAGGFGLNLTAASYVILFDPWWNPAVEAQAIDRTHRIGQKQTVFAYRLIVKDTIEEKIRQLQKQKGALAHDILGEESFAKALTLSDFQFLLGDE